METKDPVTFELIEQIDRLDAAKAATKIKAYGYSR